MLLSETIRTWDFTAGERSQPEGEEGSEIDWDGVGHKSRRKEVRGDGLTSTTSTFYFLLCFSPISLFSAGGGD